MPYDDEPYWLDMSKPSHAKANESEQKGVILPFTGRFIPDAREVIARSEKAPRAPKPSPLLEAYMIENGLPVK